MRFRNALLFCFVVCLVLSCKKDFLQRDPGTPITGDNVFSDPVLAARFADNSYNYLLDDFGRMSQGYKGTTGQFCDEAIASAASDSYPFIAVMTTGKFLDPTATDVAGVYTRMYQGIRNTNVMLSRIDTVPWTSLQSPELIRAQMLGLRATFYFELVKRFGGVVLLDKPLGLTENPDLPRSTYQQTVEFILKDLDAAEKIFSTVSFNTTVYTPDGDWNQANYGRITWGSVKALRLRLLMLDASPLRNTEGSAAKWQRAADSAKAIMDMKNGTGGAKYALWPDYAQILNRPTAISEYILIKVRGARSFGGILSDFIVPPSSGGAQGLLNPTQNHVNLYEMANGKAITEPGSGYNPQDPYKNRDPRLTVNILYNNQTWQNRTVQMYDGGTDYQPASFSTTRTRYYCKRLWDEFYKGGVTGGVYLNFVFYRITEVMMNYAEALNEAQGPVAEVYNTVNAVRARAKMPNLPAGLTKDQMRQRIHNERAVEFAFEEIRWWDLLRWKDAATIKATVRAMDVVKSGTTFIYNEVDLPATYQRIWSDRMFIYPIPRAEIDKSNGILIQNAGW